MRILFCGRFDPSYNRTRIIIEGLRKSGAEVNLYTYPKKRNANKKDLKKRIEESDLIILPSFTHTDLPFIRRLTDKPILFDPLISRYLTKVYDYKTISRNSPRALKNYLKDSRSLSRADLILADTQAHKDYYTSNYKVSPEKIKVVPIGVIMDDFYPSKKSNSTGDRITIGFYGSFIPLHGIEIVLQAAELLKDDNELYFKMIGDGVLFGEMKGLALKMGLNKVDFAGWKPYEELNREINDFDIALGIFGSSEKAKMVIPNKIFHYAACQKPVISMECDGIREIFTHNEDIYLVQPDPGSLAEGIRKLKNAKDREKIALNAYRLVTEEYNEKKIGSMVLDFIHDHL